MAVLLTVWDIFSRIELENNHFSPLHSDCRPIAEEAQQYQRNLYIAEKSFSGLQQSPCRWQYGSIFIRLAVVASQICEITRNSEKIRI